MPHLDEFNAVGALQRADHTVDAVARIAIDAAHAPSVEPFDHKIADLHAQASEAAGSEALFSMRPCCLRSPQKSEGILAWSEFQSSWIC